MSYGNTGINCAHCGQTINSTYQFCPYCSSEINPQNTSGQGFSAIVPPEIKKWNWGAFFLPIIWGPFNEVWFSLLALIPVGSLIMPIILGIKGSEWAWQCKKWDSVEHFRKTQHTWMIWGIISITAPLVMVIGIILIVVGLLGYYGIIH